MPDDDVVGGVAAFLRRPLSPQTQRVHDAWAAIRARQYEPVAYHGKMRARDVARLEEERLRQRAAMPHRAPPVVIAASARGLAGLGRRPA